MAPNDSLAAGPRGRCAGVAAAVAGGLGVRVSLPHMPFTPSHIAAVLPLRGRGAGGLPFAALAAGSMSPDLLYFQPFADWRILSPASHTVAGILTWDLLFGIGMWAVWRAGAEPVHDLAPNLIRSRWRPATWPADPRAWLLAVLAVLVGAATHVLWDEFTHAGRFGATQITAIGATYVTPWGQLQGYRLLQYASGAIGLAIIVWVGMRQPVRDAGPRPRPRLARAAMWLVPLAGLTAAVVRMATFDDLNDVRALAFAAITAAISTASTVAILITVGHARSSKSGRTLTST